MGKVVWIVNEYTSPKSIRTRQTILSQHLEEYGYKVYIFCGSSDYRGGKNAISDSEKFIFVEADGAKFYVIKTSNFSKTYERVLVSLQFQKRLWSLRKHFPEPDVIVSNFAGLFGNVFLKWKKKYETKIIFDILDLWPEGFVDMGYLKKSSIITKYLYMQEHKSYREADGIIFSMQGGRDYIIDKGWSKEVGGDVDTSSIGYLNNGIDLETVDRQRTEFVLVDPDLDTDKFKIVYLGSISAMNGLDVLIETAKVLQEQKNKKVIFLVYGEGNQEEILKKRVLDYGLENIVFKGKLDKRYAMNLLSRSDLNIFTFKDSPLWKYGVSPNKLFMYFASGRPVLSMIRPNYDIVESEACGISIDNDPVMIADAIEKIRCMRKEEYLEYCSNARNVAQKYDYKFLVKELIQKIEGVEQCNMR